MIGSQEADLKEEAHGSLLPVGFSIFATS